MAGPWIDRPLIKPLPKIGDIVLCFVPYRNLQNSGAHPHPVLVLDRYAFPSDLDRCFLTVAGGTSIYNKNGTERPRRPEEVYLDEEFRKKNTQLENPTKFGFSNEYIYALPFTIASFVSNNLNRAVIQGHIDLASGPFWDEVVNRKLDTNFASLKIAARQSLI